jgi:hypothetical protein
MEREHIVVVEGIPETILFVYGLDYETGPSRGLHTPVFGQTAPPAAC